VPLIVRSPCQQPGQRIAAPVSLVDVYPTILEAAGVTQEKGDLPGQSLLHPERLDPARTVFSEYHAIASVTGMFMVRFGSYKYIHYEGYPPQLFDLSADPHELVDLGENPDFEAVRREGEQRLRAICDPAAVDRDAFADQARRIALFGGEEAIARTKAFAFTPAPGQG
jgi:choline-sulfatase